jgi:iron(III) transport system ATP-binding protein
MIEITIRKLSVRFDGVPALDDIDVHIEAGELFLLLGPSGSGKTTLLRCIAGFTTPDRGSVEFGGENVTGLAPHLRNAAMVFQSFALWPHLTVAENVAFGLRERKVDKGEIARRVTESLESMRMREHGARRIDQLSGGEQQRVALARALVVRPRCLLLDEPLSNLDANLRHSMRDEIRRVCKEQRLTAVYVTHDQKEALAVADRIAVMKNGRILQVGTPQEIYRKPVSRGVASFVGETNLLTARIARVAGDEIVVESAIGELLAPVRDGFEWKKDDEVWVSLRPECLRLERPDDAAPGRNAIEGAIEATTYLGELAEHRFRSRSHVLRIYELNPRSGGWTSGARAIATVSPADVVLLPLEGKGA